jgi:hypothetical protein
MKAIPIFLLSLLLLVSDSLAGSIGINFGSGRPDASLAATNNAGVVAQVNWNNASGSGGSISNLQNETGSATAAGVTWSTDEEWSVGGTPADAHGTLLNGFISENNDGADSTISVTDIPFTTYDLYVYMSHDRATEDVDISGPFGTFRIHEDDTNISSPVTFNRQLASADPDTSQVGNYALFSGISGATLNLTMSPTGAHGTVDRNAIAGLQIVEAIAISGLPDVANLPATALTASSANANANLIDNGAAAAPAAVTIYWGNTDEGTSAASWQNAAAAGSFTAPTSSITTNLSSLLPNTTYFYRSFASNSAGDNWAPDTQSFTSPPAPPSVTNTAAGDILATAATVGGAITSTGGEPPTVRLFYGDNDGGNLEGNWDAFVDLGAQTNAFSTELTSLTHSTAYFFTSRATNSAGSGWAAASNSFTTTTLNLPTVTTLAATSITGNSSTLNGTVTNDGGDPPLVSFYYGKTDGATNIAAWENVVQIGIDSGNLSRSVGNLAPLSTYYFRARAVNAAGAAWAPASLTFDTPAYVPPTIIINELHIDESDKTRRGEFVELYNNSDSAIDVSNWYFSKGIKQPGPPVADFVIPGGTTIAAGDYLVIAQDPAEIVSLFAYSGALGPWSGKLSNEGETIILNDASGNVIDEVSYNLGFPWPTVGDPPSPSMELINPNLDNDLGGSWRSSGNVPAQSVSPADYILRNDENWHYRTGQTFPANDSTGKDWTKNGYDEIIDGQWLIDQAPFGQGDDDDNTILTMQGNYITVFMRHEFTIAPGQTPSKLTLRALYDDGLVIWINGVEVSRLSVDAGAIPFPPPAGFANNHEASANYEEVTISGVASYLVEGTNTLAVQLINSTITSSDSSADVELIFAGSSDGYTAIDPSPGAANSVYSINAPPQIRQVNHSPKQPASGQPVVITAKITDPDGVSAVSLQYQIVEPGDYFSQFNKFNNDGTPNANPRFESPAEWTSIPMTDDATGGDALSGDSIFSTTLPAALQTNRRLIRYRITASDPIAAVTVPYSDDPQPNFAYYVYDGTPDWSGVIRPGDTAVTFPGALMSSIPTYFLLSTSTWVNDSQFGGYTGSEYLWPGTMIYDGKVYDHIQYRPRGGVHRYQYGKNFWKFDFKRGHRFEARDRYGKRYATDWNKMNFSSIVQQVNFNHRGEQGLFEGVGFRLFELAGVPACKTHYTQFYVVDNASAEGANQYEGDYYGLFLAIEQMDGQYLDEHLLPDGNLYKIEGNAGVSNNQGPTQVSNGSDVATFISTSNGTPTAQWWQDNFNVDSYLSYRTIIEAIHHYDIANGKNFFYYHNPDTDKFQLLPWDLDLTWADNMFGSGNHPFKTKVAQNPAFNSDYQNRVREIKDLLYNNDQAWQLIDESVRDVWTPGAPSLVGADRRLWDNNPRITTKDRYYDVATDNEFSGMIQVLKNYVVSRGNWMTTNLLTNESSVPATPTITYTGVAGTPSNDLHFVSSAFSSPAGSTFAAMQWRLAEVYNPTVPNYVAGAPYIYEIENPIESGAIAPFNSDYLFPVLATRPGQTYRARVRHQDAAGRWSHWSAPFEFNASEPDVTPYLNALVISEFMFNPPAPTGSEIAISADNDDF